MLLLLSHGLYGPGYGLEAGRSRPWLSVLQNEICCNKHVNSTGCPNDVLRWENYFGMVQQKEKESGYEILFTVIVVTV